MAGFWEFRGKPQRTTQQPGPHDGCGQGSRLSGLGTLLSSQCHSPLGTFPCVRVLTPAGGCLTPSPPRRGPGLPLPWPASPPPPVLCGGRWFLGCPGFGKCPRFLTPGMDPGTRPWSLPSAWEALMTWEQLARGQGRAPDGLRSESLGVGVLPPALAVHKDSFSPAVGGGGWQLRL